VRPPIVRIACGNALCDPSTKDWLLYSRSCLAQQAIKWTVTCTYSRSQRYPRFVTGSVWTKANKQRHDVCSAHSESNLVDAFLVGLQVSPSSPAVGCTVQEAGMRGLPGLYLTSVKRSGLVIHAVGPDFLVASGDVLFFAGELSQVRQVAQSFNLRIVADAFEEDLPALMGSPRATAPPAARSGGSSPLPSFLERFTPTHNNAAPQYDSSQARRIASAAAPFACAGTLYVEAMHA
jgi:TrkA-C domain